MLSVVLALAKVDAEFAPFLFCACSAGSHCIPPVGVSRRGWEATRVYFELQLAGVLPWGVAQVLVQECEQLVEPEAVGPSAGLHRTEDE